MTEESYNSLKVNKVITFKRQRKGQGQEQQEQPQLLAGCLGKSLGNPKKVPLHVWRERVRHTMRNRHLSPGARCLWHHLRQATPVEIFELLNFHLVASRVLIYDLPTRSCRHPDRLIIPDKFSSSQTYSLQVSEKEVNNMTHTDKSRCLSHHLYI